MTRDELMTEVEGLKAKTNPDVVDHLKVVLTALLDEVGRHAIFSIPDLAAAAPTLDVAVRQVYHVVPSEKGKWRVEVEGNDTLGRSFKGKFDALVWAKKSAKASGLGQVIVHKKDGQIQAEYTYGSDPAEKVG